MPATLSTGYSLGVLQFTIASASAADVLGHVKAGQPESRLLDVTALGPDGQIYGINAIERNNNHPMMDVKAIMRDELAPIKMLLSNDERTPVKAIGPRGEIFEVKALTPDDKTLDVKGIRTDVSIIPLKAIGPDGMLYGVKAIFRDGHVHEVKGVKMYGARKAGTINGLDIEAHV
jgi:hypothetical protein